MTGPNKLCGRQPLKNLKIFLSRPYPFKFFKGCLSQNLLSPLLNTLSQMILNLQVGVRRLTLMFLMVQMHNFFSIQFNQSA